jgi:hypothetical protein
VDIPDRAEEVEYTPVLYTGYRKAIYGKNSVIDETEPQILEEKFGGYLWEIVASISLKRVEPGIYETWHNRFQSNTVKSYEISDTNYGISTQNHFSKFSCPILKYFALIFLKALYHSIALSFLFHTHY